MRNPIGQTLGTSSDSSRQSRARSCSGPAACRGELRPSNLPVALIYEAHHVSTQGPVRSSGESRASQVVMRRGVHGPSRASEDGTNVDGPASSTRRIAESPQGPLRQSSHQRSVAAEPPEPFRPHSRPGTASPDLPPRRRQPLRPKQGPPLLASAQCNPWITRPLRVVPSRAGNAK